MKIPKLTAEDSVIITKKLYGIDSQATRLVSYDDANFLMEAGPSSYILKVSNLEASRGYVSTQSQVMETLSQSGLAAPKVLAEGLEDLAGDQHIVRLLSFVPGTFWSAVRAKNTDFYAGLGGFYGQVGKALLEYRHDHEDKTHRWDLKNALGVRHWAEHIEDHSRRRLVQYFFQQFEQRTQPRLAGLRQSQIHGDANQENVLVTPGGFGLIDFGDTVRGPLIAELAILSAYALLDEGDYQGRDLELCTVLAHGYHNELPLQAAELEVLYDLIVVRLAVSVSVSSHALLSRPDDDYLKISREPAFLAMERWLRLSPDLFVRHLKNALGFEGGKLESADLLGRRQQNLGANLGMSYKEPIQVTGSALCYLYDENRAYLDCVNNVPHVGHCHPHLVSAIQQQAARLNTNSRYLTPELVDYSERLLAEFPEELSVVYLVTSGTEANELALRLARSARPNRQLFCFEDAYHGNSEQMIGLSSYKFANHPDKGPLDFAHILKRPDSYRGEFRGPNSGEGYLAELSLALKKLSEPPLGMLVEPLMGCAGQVVLPEGYLAEACRLIQDAGGLFIADEVQIGLGRTGIGFSAAVSLGTKPDIITLGKPLGGSFPMSAVITTREVAAAFDDGMEFFSTFGGSSLACAAGGAVLDILAREELVANAKSTGDFILAEFNKLKSDYAYIGDVRGMGLFLGIEIVKETPEPTPDPEKAERLVEAMKAAGVLISVDGGAANVLKLKPPLIFGRLEAEELLRAFKSLL